MDEAFEVRPHSTTFDGDLSHALTVVGSFGWLFEYWRAIRATLVRPNWFS